jgi:cellulose biosynthesis protein BcsQ
MSIDPTPKTAAPFITFYSFKGGVGRSMALINTAAILAGRGFRVLVIDFDLEAPGLSYLARTAAASQGAATDSAMPPGLIDLLGDAKERGLEADLFARPMQEVADIYTRPYPLENPEVGGALFIMPAGKMDQGYTKRFDDLSLRELYGEGVGEPLMRIFKEKFAESDLYDYVLIDSRTGFSDEAGICTQDLADFMMIFSGLNKQNIEGTAAFLQALRFASEGKAKFQIILSPVPVWEDDLFAVREQIAQERFNQAWGSEVDLSLQIPYHPRLALTEEPQVFTKRGGALLAAYRAIEQTMLIRIMHDVLHLEHEFYAQLKLEKYRTALRTLQRLVRFDGGNEALTDVVIHWAQPDEKNHRYTNKMKPLFSILADEAGHELIAFLVDHVSCASDSGEATSFAIDLAEQDTQLAGKLYQRLVDENPESAIILGNYGQFLLGLGQFSAGEQSLLSAILQLAPSDNSEQAEFYFSLWLAARLQAKDATQWLERYKFYLLKDFERLPWNFNAMLAQAAKILTPDELAFAQALAAAFLNQDEVAHLAQYPQWQSIELQLT